MNEDERHAGREDTVRDILKDFDARRKKQEEDIHLAALKKRKKEFLVRTAAAVGVFVVAALMTYMAYLTVRQSRLFQGPRYWALGRPAHEDPKMNLCIGNLWKIRRAVDIYYTSHGNFPDSMDAIYKDGQIVVKYLSPFLVCPGSGKEYVFKELDGKNIFCCPSPETHGVRDIFVEVRSGAPVVKEK
ncbi:MAG: hypothetical protein NT145_05975 [Elusimicrobia bacterium]|nr:hypothetical protein [Elusimicrobiota bacterium]